jgi:hypothetical protein
LHARSNDIIIGTFILIFSFNLIGKWQDSWPCHHMKPLLHGSVLT